jgi:hypothetical protein
MESSENTENPWQPILFFLGKWEGTGERGNSSVEHTYEYILQDKFIHTKTKAVFKPKEGEKTAEIHEDWGIFSYDPAREKLILRQFLTEGFVNTYVLEEVGTQGKILIFATESTEGAGGTQARLQYEILNEDEYSLVLELAPPGKEFFECSRMRMKRFQ